MSFKEFVKEEWNNNPNGGRATHPVLSKYGFVDGVHEPHTKGTYTFNKDDLWVVVKKDGSWSSYSTDTKEKNSGLDSQSLDVMLKGWKK